MTGTPRPFWAVLKATLLSTFGISVLKWRYLRRREKLWEPLLILYGIGSLAAFFGYGAYQMALSIATVGKSLSQPEVVLGMALAGFQSIVLLLGIYWVLSAFFFARDLNILVPLPISPRHIVMAKFAAVMAGEYVTGLFLFVPALLAYAKVQGLGVIQALVAILVFLVSPVVPLVISSLIALLLMRVINREHRDRYVILFSILLLVVMLGFQAMIIRATSTRDPSKYLMELVSTRFGLLRQATGFFPTALWGAIAVTGWPTAESILYLALTIGSAAIAWFLLGAAGEKLFFRGLIGGNEAGRGKRVLVSTRRRSAGAGLLNAPTTALRAIAWREWTTFSRVPLWVMNGLIPALLIPFVLLMPSLASGNAEQFIGFLRNSQFRTLVGLAIAALLTFLGALNTFASTSISREGRRFWISRVIPVEPALQVRAKLVTATIVAAVCSVPTLVAFTLLVKPSPIHVVFPALIGLAGGITGMALGLRIDMARPMLRWEDPQEPVKRNINGIIPIAVPFAYFLVGGALARSMLKAAWPSAAIYGAMLVLAAVPAALLWKNAMASAERAYRRVED